MGRGKGEKSFGQGTGVASSQEEYPAPDFWMGMKPGKEPSVEAQCRQYYQSCREVYVMDAKIYFGMNQSSQSFPTTVIIMLFVLKAY
ncbi:hypothetical protein llap_8927 [Limosa lapponica baueri]|uniref:Uncharacterized protein n=1 Tax=Limosa lapponica baueri TaxID=1758121 RepID=A0A2I0U415_LIMLA|nr:hypothetical protein llap_8927 [Limosa lapponica baueri]